MIENKEASIKALIGTWVRVMVGIVKIIDAGLMASGKIAITFTSFSKISRGQQPETQVVDGLYEIRSVDAADVESERSRYLTISSALHDSILDL
jgi:hypothetical protein